MRFRYRVSGIGCRVSGFSPWTGLRCGLRGARYELPVIKVDNKISYDIQKVENVLYEWFYDLNPEGMALLYRTFLYL